MNEKIEKRALNIQVPDLLYQHIQTLADAATVMLGRRVTISELCRQSLAAYLKFSEVQYSKNAQSQAVMAVYDELNRCRNRKTYKEENK
jgi:hypothetical protein